MATAYLRADPAPVIIPANILTAARVLGQLDRENVAATVEVLVGLLDALDDDQDIEANGDELDGTGAEDCFSWMATNDYGPGCPVADPDLGAEDEGEPEESDREQNHAEYWA